MNNVRCERGHLWQTHRELSPSSPQHFSAFQVIVLVLRPTILLFWFSSTSFLLFLAKKGLITKKSNGQLTKPVNWPHNSLKNKSASVSFLFHCWCQTTFSAVNSFYRLLTNKQLHVSLISSLTRWWPAGLNQLQIVHPCTQWGVFLPCVTGLPERGRGGRYFEIESII